MIDKSRQSTVIQSTKPTVPSTKPAVYTFTRFWLSDLRNITVEFLKNCQYVYSQISNSNYWDHTFPFPAKIKQGTTTSSAAFANTAKV